MGNDSTLGCPRLEGPVETKAARADGRKQPSHKPGEKGQTVASY